MKPQWVREISKVDLAYLAGLIDGEGSISATVAARKNRPHPAYILRVNVCNTYKPVIDWIESKVPGSRCSFRPTLGNSKRLWTITFSFSSAIEVLQAVRPYLRIKHEQADIVMALWKQIDRANTKAVSDEVHAWRRSQVERVQRLNRFGEHDE